MGARARDGADEHMMTARRLRVQPQRRAARNGRGATNGATVSATLLQWVSWSVHSWRLPLRPSGGARHWRVIAAYFSPSRPASAERAKYMRRRLGHKPSASRTATGRLVHLCLTILDRLLPWAGAGTACSDLDEARISARPWSRLQTGTFLTRRASGELRDHERAVAGVPGLRCDAEWSGP